MQALTASVFPSNAFAAVVAAAYVLENAGFKVAENLDGQLEVTCAVGRQLFVTPTERVISRLDGSKTYTRNYDLVVSGADDNLVAYAGALVSLSSPAAE